MAIRNAAPALIECAELLRDARKARNDTPGNWPGNYCLPSLLIERIDAALARLEGNDK
jgi:hypothetical protein